MQGKKNRGRSPTVGQPATGRWLDSRRRANDERSDGNGHRIRNSERTGLKGRTEVQRRGDHRLSRGCRRPRDFEHDKTSYLLGRVNFWEEIRMERKRLEQKRRKQKEERKGRRFWV
ncbi:hypothetical protein LINPERPRIM_LOCUS8881 [Linum perenne]